MLANQERTRPSLLTKRERERANMVLLFSSSSRASFSALSSSSPLSFSSSFSRGSSTLAITNGAPISRFLVKPIDWHAKLFNRVSIPAPTATNKRAGIMANVSSEIPDGGKSQSESDDDEDVPFDKLPLKLQQKLEHKMRMKLSNKKIRLRRKKLVRKRRMRKRGCWPPSKMKKMSNV